MKIIYQFTDQQIKELHQLYQQEWWTNTRTLKQTISVVNGSQICIGLVNEQNQLCGFARVLTDYTFKALIFDVIVAKEARGKGLGDKLISLIKDHPELAQIKSFELYCLPDMFAFYQQHGFSTDIGDMKLMRLTNV